MLLEAENVKQQGFTKMCIFHIIRHLQPGPAGSKLAVFGICTVSSGRRDRRKESVNGEQLRAPSVLQSRRTQGDLPAASDPVLRAASCFPGRAGLCAGRGRARRPRGPGGHSDVAGRADSRCDARRAVLRRRDVPAGTVRGSDGRGPGSGRRTRRRRQDQPGGPGRAGLAGAARYPQSGCTPSVSWSSRNHSSPSSPLRRIYRRSSSRRTSCSRPWRMP